MLRRIALSGPAGLRLSRTYVSRTTTDNPVPTNTPSVTPQTPVSATNDTATSPMGAKDKPLQESVATAEELRSWQAPNRKDVWSTNQRPRNEAMTGPRFEQMIMADQPLPWSAMELIHQQPVRWTDSRVVSCDGGGGPLGHPRIFINVDKPQICFCTYCGVPFAHEHHRKHLENLPSTTYPLENPNEEGTLPQSHTIRSSGSTEPLQSSTQKPLEQR
ncbi:hypothetical protein K470DRAFT_239693 [Piedraia hortae CBS 480.64]|uniref:Zinc finger CHCC-type domain-containing protein n=1 Tax=Piedraia hortae CBS 480.64 TaxID=1314780 RepID=A0A6A7CAK6_9PEZI|nr:hypothetical protein K470DRAFT_239693 [Piedraia hortae CBS 480.64]